jgi:DDE domain
VQHYLWRAVDQNGAMIDILVQSKRDRFAAMVLPKALGNQSLPPSRDHYRQASKLWRCQESNPASSDPPTKPVLKQSSREFTSADATTRAPYETLQVAGACATFSGDTRYCVCPLSTETTSAPCRMLPSGKAAPISDMEADHRCLSSLWKCILARRPRRQYGSRST